MTSNVTALRRTAGTLLAILCSFCVFGALGRGAEGEYETGLGRLRSGYPGEALPFLEAARKQSPRDPDVLYNLAGCYFALGRTENGTRTILDLAEQNRQDPAVLLAAGSLLAGQRLYDRASQLLVQADALAPGNPLVLNALARAQSQAGHYDDAAGSLERLMSHLRSAATPETQSVLTQAFETAAALQGRQPASARTGFLAAEFGLLADHATEALGILRRLEATANRNPDYYKLLGLAYARLDQYPAAVQAEQRGLALAPDREDLLLNLAAVYQKERNNQDAIQLLQRAVQRGSTTTEIYFALALSQFNFGSYSETVRNCDRALAVDSHFDRALLLKGRAYERLSRPQDAIKCLRRAVELNPGSEYCRYELAIVLAGNGQPREAEPLLREIVRVSPSNATAQFQLGKLLASRADTAGAIVALEAAVAADPNQDSAWYLLGRVYLQKGDKAQAARALDVVKRIKRERREAAEARLASSLTH